MLPAYFASSFQNRRLLVAMTFLFAAGVGTVILPLVLGASLLRQLLVTQHTAVYAFGGTVMSAWEFTRYSAASFNCRCRAAERQEQPARSRSTRSARSRAWRAPAVHQFLPGSSRFPVLHRPSASRWDWAGPTLRNGRSALSDLAALGAL